MKPKLKIAILHPPMYPVNYHLYNLLSDYCEIDVFQFGEFPSDHVSWTVGNLKSIHKKFEFKVYGEGSDSILNQVSYDFVGDIIKNRYDIVISVAFWLPSIVAALTRKIKGFKLIIITDANEFTEKNVSAMRSFQRKLLCRNVDGFISCSSLTSKYLLSLGVNHSKIFESFQTIDISSWNLKFDSLEDKTALRHRLNLPLFSKIMLSVGGLTTKKNASIGFSILRESSNLHYVVVGEGPELDGYFEAVKNLGISDKVTFVGRKEGDYLIEYFKSSDFFIFPSLYDQYGFVVVEALASGLPVLCSDKTGASSLIKDGFNGYLIDPSSIDSRIVIDLIDNIAFMQRDARFSVDELTLENRAKEFNDIFLKVLN
ncbi:glycosyltransferase [Shewanella sp. KCT]|uniref:glycosyltransferase n=1 Tax=Shewanella sp. KCT TaxID=2569535 RepID=UPI001183D8A7|nr:glycosyltransferase [Shewanella sp. KCT]TVP10595.1 hypothetical protein AYI87_17705 [Shewanella sp. KCT]